MIMISKYQLAPDNAGRLRVKSLEISICPICGEAFRVIGTRKRGFINGNGKKQMLIISRLRCKGCRTIHHELPDIIIPYRRHSSETIEKIITNNIDTLDCETSTIRKIKAWWTSCLLYFKSILAALREKYRTEFPANPAPREIVRAVTNANLWIHTRSAYVT
jgi:hypothetical protein